MACHIRCWLPYRLTDEDTQATSPVQSSRLAILMTMSYIDTLSTEHLQHTNCRDQRISQTNSTMKPKLQTAKPALDRQLTITIVIPIPHNNEPEPAQKTKLASPLHSKQPPSLPSYTPSPPSLTDAQSDTTPTPTPPQPPYPFPHPADPQTPSSAAAPPALSDTTL